MFTISAKDNIAELTKDLGLWRDQIPFAASLALNNTARSAKSDLVGEMQKVFDRPTPYTLNSIFIKPSSKTDLKVVIWLKDDTFKGTPASRYLAPQIFGGERSLKRFERALSFRGLLPQGMIVVPGKGAQLDQYGNISRGQIVQILSSLRAFGGQGYAANRTARSIKRAGRRAEYFVGRPGRGLPLGVWQRMSFAMGSAVRPVLMFVKPKPYMPRFEFFPIAERAFKREFDGQFVIAMNYAIATAGLNR
jgi:hypothetical protein